MLDDDWNRLTKTFPRVLAGARVETGALPATDERQPPFICAAFSPDDSLVALSGGGRIPSKPGIWVARVPSLDTHAVLRGHQGVHDLAWDPQTALLASASNDYTCALWDVERRDHLFVCGGDDEPIVKGRLAFGGGALYVGETEAFSGLRPRVLRVPLATGRVEIVHTLAARQAVAAIAVGTDEHWAIAVRNASASTLIGGQRATKDAGEHVLDGELRAMGFRDGALVIATTRDDAVEIHAGDHVVRAHQPELDVASFSVDGQRLALSHGKQLRVLATADASIAWSTELQVSDDSYATTVLAWSHDGERLAVAGFGLVAIVDARSGGILTSVVPPKWFR